MERPRFLVKEWPVRADHGGVEGEPDRWDQVGQTLDWVAGLVATRVDRDPDELVWPTIGVGLGCGLGAEAVGAAAGADRALLFVGVSLTLSGFGMLALLVRRLRRGHGGGARTGEAAVLEPWLRRLQVLLAAVLVAVLALLVAGAVGGSVVLVGRNILELGRVGTIVLAISFLLLDDEVGLPDWLGSLRPATAASRH